MAYNITDVAGTADLSVLGPMIAAFIAVFIILAIGVYVYTSFALMAIAKKTKTERVWLAWIPIANIYLMTQIGDTPWWTMLFLLFSWVPVFGVALSLGLTIYWWWNIAEARKMEGWLGILMAVPIVNLVVMGIIAWSKK